MKRSPIRIKIGQCEDCPEGSPDKPLTKKKCGFHYRIYLNTKNKNKPANVEKINVKKDLTVFFASQILEAPDYCENECGTSIVYFRNIRSRVIVAHILPKRKNGGFPTVATHPKNRVFLCPDCHTDFDNKGADFARTMPALKIMRERFAEFGKLLTVGEFMRVPDYLK